MFDKYHPGFFGKVGMRYFHLSKNKYHCPIINLDKIWTLVGEEVRGGGRPRGLRAHGGGEDRRAGRQRALRWRRRRQRPPVAAPRGCCLQRSAAPQPSPGDWVRSPPWRRLAAGGAAC